MARTSFTAKQTVYLDGDRKRALPEGHPEARIKLVHQGQEIPEAEAERYDGAIDLIKSELDADAVAEAQEEAREASEQAAEAAAEQTADEATKPATKTKTKSRKAKAHRGGVL